MLYATTRSNQDTYTAFHALGEDRSPDGGFYVPLHLAPLSREELDALKEKSPNQTMAEVLSRLFCVQLTGWDVDFAIGRRPVRLRGLNHRITVAESWHNLDWDFSWSVENLAALIRGTRDHSLPVGSWTAIAARIGVIFGIVGQLMQQGSINEDTLVDIAVPSGDLSVVMSAWYARKMGLPIGNIIICCNENNNLWDLINHGQLRTNTPPVATSTPLCDHTVAPHLEQLVHGCGGVESVETFLRSCQNGRSWFPGEAVAAQLQKGMYVSVVGQKRLKNTIPNAYSTHGYVFGPYSALAYGGLLDYRSRTGESRPALILSETGALCDDGFVAQAMGISVEALHKILE